MVYNWYEFTYRRGKVKWIKPVKGMQATARWHNVIDEGKPTHSNLICAKDELDAYKIVSKWLRLGKPLDVGLGDEMNISFESKGVWRYTPDV